MVFRAPGGKKVRQEATARKDRKERGKEGGTEGRKEGGKEGSTEGGQEGSTEGGTALLFTAALETLAGTVQNPNALKPKPPKALRTVRH